MSTVHRYERTDRVAQLVRGVVAAEMERLDEAFEGVVITGVDVDRELSAALVHYDVRDDDAANAATEAFAEYRHRFQRALGEATSLKRTPALRFRQDQGPIAAKRIEELLRGLADPKSQELGMPEAATQQDRGH